jgi:hypothetical protein
MGDKVALKNFDGYRGGLDTKSKLAHAIRVADLITGDSTGTHSVYSKFHGLNVMFHVATLLPHSSLDPQQV